MSLREPLLPGWGMQRLPDKVSVGQTIDFITQARAALGLVVSLDTSAALVNTVNS